MYHPRVITARLSKLAEQAREHYPKFDFREFSVAEVDERVEHLNKLYDPEKMTLSRPLNVEEQLFIRHEILRSKADSTYWLPRYAWIKTKSQEMKRIVPTAVQAYLLKRIADEELVSMRGETGDGIIFMVLKARQLGVSTLSEGLIAHRTVFYSNTSAMIAADVEQRSAHLYMMLERVYDNLPWWMKPFNPERDYRVKGKQLYFADQDALITVGWGKNLQGGHSGLRGSLGTGMTLPLVHLSELAVWENAEQIDDALMPSIPMHPRTFAIFESTAKGRGNWWHQKWMIAKKGIGRRKPVFIGWYVDPETYKLPAPTDWTPSDLAVAHAKRVKETSNSWLGYTVDLTRNQLYWWERTRAEYIENHELSKFLAEYTADDMESFQNTTVSTFPSEMTHEMRLKAKPEAALLEILPRSDLRMEQLLKR